MVTAQTRQRISVSKRSERLFVCAMFKMFTQARNCRQRGDGAVPTFYIHVVRAHRPYFGRATDTLSTRCDSQICNVAPMRRSHPKPSDDVPRLHSDVYVIVGRGKRGAQVPPRVCGGGLLRNSKVVTTAV